MGALVAPFSPVGWNKKNGYNVGTYVAVYVET